MLLDSEREEKEFLTELWWVFLEFNLHLFRDACNFGMLFLVLKI